MPYILLQRIVVKRAYEVTAAIRGVCRCISFISIATPSVFLVTGHERDDGNVEYKIPWKDDASRHLSTCHFVVQ
jgi:hypothetical protein